MTSALPANTIAGATPAFRALLFWAGLVFVAVAFGLLELPGVLMTCQGVWQGLAAEYNPYTFLGSPTPSIGGVYPPMYLAYGVARHLLGDEHATLDMFAAIPAAANEIRVRYSPPRAVGVTIAAVLAMLGGAVTLACQRKSS